MRCINREQRTKQQVTPVSLPGRITGAGAIKKSKIIFSQILAEPVGIFCFVENDVYTYRYSPSLSVFANHCRCGKLRERVYTYIHHSALMVEAANKG